MSMGSALATGLAQGLGEGLGSHFDDMQRERLDAQKSARALDNFKKQSQYQANIAAIGRQDVKGEEWEATSKLSAKQLANKISLLNIKNYKAADQARAYRDSMKNLNGTSTVEMLDILGLTKPDYSKWQDNPDYADSIPKPSVGGIPGNPTADQLFTYTDEGEEAAKDVAKLTDYMRKKKDSLDVIKSTSLMNRGASTSDAVSLLLWQKRPKGDGVEAKGADVIDYDSIYLDSLINQGKVVQVGAELKFKTELTEQEKDELGMPTVSSKEPTSGSMYEVKQTADYIKKEEAKVLATRQRIDSAAVEAKRGLAIKSYMDLQDLSNRTKGLSEEAKEILFGGMSVRGMLSMSDFAKKIAAKGNFKGAKEAREYLAYMETLSAALKHEQYGSAQTEKELKNFADQLGNPGVLQNMDTLLAQINARTTSVGNTLKATVGIDKQAAYMAQHPALAERLQGAFGVEEKEEAIKEVQEAAGGTSEEVTKVADEQTAKDLQEAFGRIEPTVRTVIQKYLDNGTMSESDALAYIRETE